VFLAWVGSTSGWPGTGVGPAAPSALAAQPEAIRCPRRGCLPLRDNDAWRWAAASLRRFRRESPAPHGLRLAHRRREAVPSVPPWLKLLSGGRPWRSSRDQSCRLSPPEKSQPANDLRVMAPARLQLGRTRQQLLDLASQPSSGWEGCAPGSASSVPRGVATHKAGLQKQAGSRELAEVDRQNLPPRLSFQAP